MASVEELKARINLHELAAWLGMEQPGGRGNYRAAWRDDKRPSVSIFADGKAWKDHAEDCGGSAIDLVMKARGCDMREALRLLHQFAGLPLDEPKPSAPREKTLAEYIAERCREDVTPVKAWLVEARGINEAAVDKAIKAGTLGYNAWTSAKAEPGEFGHGGPAAAFLVRNGQGRIVAVEMRYFDPDLNGGVKTQCQGDKSGHFWTSDYRKLTRAHTVYIVESPINALSIDSCPLPDGAVAIATLGKANIARTDWGWLRGKRVIICMDNDTEPDSSGFLPGQKAAWDLYDRLTGLNIAAHIVDQAEWEHNDVNDILRADGSSRLAGKLRRLEPWIIPGLWPDDPRPGRKRLHLPLHDHSRYYRFRTREDFTAWVKHVDTDNETGEEKLEFVDLCGFRVAQLSRVRVLSSTSITTGEQDHQSHTMISVSVQVARHGNELIRHVMTDDKLYKLEQWTRFGGIYEQKPFFRMLNILERSANLGARSVANFVGLCWKDGRLIVNEGPDCYFRDPNRQCIYSNLVFNRGPASNARPVIDAYHQTFGGNAALILLTWALGAHLKALLGYWPHMTLQADKGSGKSTLLARMERTLGMQVLSGQSIATEFRIVTSISNTSHPIGWEELSAREQKVIDKAVGMLQEAYQFKPHFRGSELLEFLLCAPVLIAGEDVPVKSLTGKIVRVDLARKGPMLPDRLPPWPMRAWLGWLADLAPERVRKLHAECKAWARKVCSADLDADPGAARMTENYAALACAWRLMSEFAGIDPAWGGMPDDLSRAMNAHIMDTATEREPWVWILEILLSEISAGHYRHPYAWENILDEHRQPTPCLVVRTSHVMDHIAHEMRLRERWNALPVKSDRVFKRQLKAAGVVLKERVDVTVSGRRCCHMTALNIEELAKYGLHAEIPDDHGDANIDPFAT